MKLPFDRVEVTIKGYIGKKTISYNQMWSRTELENMHPSAVSNFVANKITDITQVMTGEV